MAGSNVIVRLILAGRQAFAAEASAAGGSLRHIESGAAGASTALAATGRALMVVSAAAGAAAVAAGVVGAKYDAMQDSQRVAFTTFLGSAQAAEKFMRQLQDLAQRSPVLDPKTTGEGARALMAYGLSAKQTLPFVEALGDMSAASGRSIAEVLPNAARAIGQIASKGKLQTEELNQLAESVGLNRNRIAEALNMTRDEFASLFTPGNNLEASKALPAVLEAMRKQSAGAANRLAQTTAGRFDRLKEMLSRRAGEAIRPFYNYAGTVFARIADGLTHVDTKRIGRRVHEMLTGVFTGAGGGGGVRRGDFGGQMIGMRLRGAFDGVVRAIRVVVPAVRNVVGQVIDALRPAEPFLRNVILPLLGGIAAGVIGGVVMAFRVAIPIIKVLAQGLGWLGNVLRPLRPVFAGLGLVIGIVFGPGILGRAIGLTGRLAGAMSGSLSYALRAVQWAMAAMRVPLSLLSRGLGIVTGAVGRLAAAFGRGLTWVGRFGAGLSGTARTVVVRVHNMIQSVISFLGNSVGRVMSAAGRIGRAIVDGVVNAIKSAPGAIADAISSVVPDPVKGAVSDVVGLARKVIPRAGGGMVRSGEVTLVGERGPELARFPGGTRITPAARTASVLAGAAPASAPRVASAMRDIVIRFEPVLDGRPIHQSVHRIERAALEAS